MNNNFENKNGEKIVIYKTNNCLFHKNYIYCDHIKHNILNNYLNVISENNKVIYYKDKDKDNDEYRKNNDEMVKILCYTY